MKVRGKLRLVRLKRVLPNPWNPNEQDEEMYAKTRASLRRYGQLEPVLVRQHPKREGCFQIINGEHRWRAVRDEGGKKVLVNDLGRVKTRIAKHLTLIMNELHGRANEVKLANVLADLQSLPEEDRAIIPFSQEEIDALLAFTDDQKVDEFLNTSPNSDGAGEEEEDGKWTTYSFKVPSEHTDKVNAAMDRFRRKVKVASPRTVRDGLAFVEMLKHAGVI